MGSGQTRGDDDEPDNPYAPINRSRKPVTAVLIHTVQVSFKHGQVLCQVLANDSDQSSRERIIPEGWELNRVQNYPGNSFANFVMQDEGMPKQEDIDEIVRKIELLDAAVEAMLAK